jgi:hypothetical protein
MASIDMIDDYCETWKHLSPNQFRIKLIEDEIKLIDRSLNRLYNLKMRKSALVEHLKQLNKKK